MSTKIFLYDTTLRDGAQSEDVNLSATDKVRIARQLDYLGMDYIEGGWPGANPVETEFFVQAGSPGAVSAIKKIGVEQAQTVVKTAIRRAKRGKDISLSSRLAKSIHVLSKILPHGFVLWVEKHMGMY